jgi:hypothetical protein
MSGDHVWAGHALWDEIPDLPPLGDPRLPEWLNLPDLPDTEIIGLLDPDTTHFGVGTAVGVGASRHRRGKF